MEKALEKQLEETFRIPGVVGVMCVDNNGLCLGAKGNTPRGSSGSISALASQATKLSTNGTNPVICLESEHGSVLIKKNEKLTTAIYKSS
ncbi:ragulator complex protein LAMTOR5 [Biomphalaria glabrata]|uniref:Late endosomal/lysosomal adaptor and MAPK and MTOR activator 5 n=1 Tax=Biomphalaria glabrata TaxID=6526 RepID=A0A2C9LAB9_BIOGL|nr:ragulator complex protein LAMTOR5-like [Biomphalaria glabrata]KAI8771620.1 ragulator complex protein LAMTOR5 [Biomphalaria glabrata]